MGELHGRLVRCFQAVFPTLSDREAPSASVTSVRGWDSLATIKLVALVEEEFGVSVPVEELGRFVSFPLIVDYLRSGEGVTPGAAGPSAL
jgi:acyl carrier protein